MARDVTRLVLKVAVLALPLLVVNALYFVRDPFRVLYRHEPLNDPASHVIVNRDFMSTELLVDTFAARRYDAFIFGNSRTLAFRCDDWAARIGARHPFHYDASDESLYGIWGKLRLLDRLGVKIRDVLIVLDRDTLRNVTDRRGHLFAAHPLVSGASWLAYQRIFYEAFFSRGFYWKYAALLATGEVRWGMWEVLDPRILSVVPETNDLILTTQEEELARDGEDAYYARRDGTFPPRGLGGNKASRVIGYAQRGMLADMHALLVRHGARWRIVISPLYNQVALAAGDVAVLRKIFGAGTVFDYSGKNAITDDVRNYYEKSHYRPHVGRLILDQLYAG